MLQTVLLVISSADRSQADRPVRGRDGLVVAYARRSRPLSSRLADLARSHHMPSFRAEINEFWELREAGRQNETDPAWVGVFCAVRLPHVLC